MGGKKCGKSTLVVQFLNPNKGSLATHSVICLIPHPSTVAEEKQKSTVALEYTFGRRSNSSSSAKDIAHIWELGTCLKTTDLHLGICPRAGCPAHSFWCSPYDPGGGEKLNELLAVPLSVERLQRSVVAIVLDLSKVRISSNYLLKAFFSLGIRLHPVYLTLTCCLLVAGGCATLPDLLAGPCALPVTRVLGRDQEEQPCTSFAAFAVVAVRPVVAVSSLSRRLGV